ncbi:hypothetical protein ACXZ65_34525 [Streptomyces aculeolatus]
MTTAAELRARLQKWTADDTPVVLHPQAGRAFAAWLESAAVDAEQTGLDPSPLAAARAIGGDSTWAPATT